MSNILDFVNEGISIPLTKLAAGYTPQGLIAEKVFPVTTSILSSGSIPVYNKDAFKIYNTYRALNAKSNRARPSPDSWITYTCEEHDLAIPLDQRLIDELNNIPIDSRGKALFGIENRIRRRVQWNLALEAEKAVADMVQATANYPSGHSVTLTGTDQFSDHDNSDPVTVIEDAREQIRSALGVYPNKMVMGAAVYKELKFHPAYTDIMKSTSDKVVRPALIAQLHDLNEITIGMSMNLSEDDDATFVDLWGKDIILYYAPSNTFPDVEEPSFGYRIRPAFSSKPYPYVDIFREEGGKIVNIRCTDMYDDVFILGTAGYLIKDAVA